jgi:hypothetical protein
MPETGLAALAITCCAMRAMATQHITDTLGDHRLLGGSQEE